MDYIYGDAFLDCLFCAASVLSQCVFLASMSTFYLHIWELALVWSVNTSNTNYGIRTCHYHQGPGMGSLLSEVGCLNARCPVWAPIISSLRHHCVLLLGPGKSRLMQSSAAEHFSCWSPAQNRCLSSLVQQHLCGHSPSLLFLPPSIIRYQEATFSFLLTHDLNLCQTLANF